MADDRTNRGGQDGQRQPTKEPPAQSPKEAAEGEQEAQPGPATAARDLRGRMKPRG
jgi:hypothetical protein